MQGLHKMPPILGITMGDPAGVGPEIVLKALNRREVYTRSRPLVIGDAETLMRARDYSRLSIKINRLSHPKQARFQYGIVDVLDLANVGGEGVPPGRLSAKAGRAAMEYIYKAVDLALAGELHAVVTCPINKEAINLAGYRYSGHSEIFAERTKTKDYALMLVAGKVRALHLSTHTPLRKACELVTKERVLKAIRLAAGILAEMGMPLPRIAVAGLNPHAGEGGLFGEEEQREIIPAMEAAKEEGYLVSGPFPPDTVFLRAAREDFDCVIAMYHDQGHIPLKLLGFEKGVSITVGLPIVRTSVDHGTAFDIAGKGIADPGSLLEAIKLAAQMARLRSELISRP